MANAATITQTKPFSSLSTSGQLFSWNQFDSSLGTLDSISLKISGSATGRFSVTTTAEDAVSVSSPTARLRLLFSGSGRPPSAETQTLLTALPVTPSVDPSFSVPGTSTQAFALSTDPLGLTDVNAALIAYASYFTGTGTVSSTLSRPFALTTVGGENTSDTSTLLTYGTVELIYNYTPVPVPEPSTYALAAAGLGIVGFVRARRRKSGI